MGAGASRSGASASRTLYERLGGWLGITGICLAGVTVLVVAVCVPLLMRHTKPPPLPNCVGGQVASRTCVCGGKYEVPKGSRCSKIRVYGPWMLTKDSEKQ